MNNTPGLRAAGILSIVLLLALAAVMGSQPAPREQVGPLPRGGFLLNSGWRVAPAGRQVPLDTLPMSTALSPDGKYLLVLNAGFKPPSISVVEIASARVVSSIGGAGCVAGPGFRAQERPAIRGWRGTGVGFRVYVSRMAPSRPGGPSKRSPRAARTGQDFVGDVAFSPDGRLLYAAELYRDSVAVINPQSGMVIDRIKTGRRPYRILFHPDGKSFFVTHWADGSVGHYDAANGSQLARLRIGAHPTDMVWRDGRPGGSGGGRPGLGGAPVRGRRQYQ